MITDAHNHLQALSETNPERYGIDRCVSCGTSPADWSAALDLAQREPAVTAAIGLHPWFIEDAPTGWAANLSKLLEANPDVAVGEIGLDKTNRSPDLETQTAVFATQLHLATTHRRTAIVHCVRAYGLLHETLAAADLQAPVILHAYTGSPEMIPRFAALAVPVFFSVSKPGLLTEIPADRLLIESDASPDNGATPAHAVRFHREHGLDPAQTAANYEAAFGRVR